VLFGFGSVPTQLLLEFRDWLGGETNVGSISGRVLTDYRQALLTKVDTEKWSRTTASDALTVVKMFVR
jgi:hypothetical protein